MNSGISNFEKSIEECVNYNFDDDSPLINYQKRASKSLDKDLKLNGQLNNSLTNWSNFNNIYPWLYVVNNNPNCSFCEKALNSPGMISTCWTNSETPLEIDDSVLDEAQILKLHSKSENHMIAFHYMVDNSLIDKNKSEKENEQIDTDKCDIPHFMPITEWDELRKTFSWLYYKLNSFRCIYCEEGYEKQRKSMFPTVWSCPDRMKQSGDISQKSFRSVNRFEKHQMSINHIKAIEIINAADSNDGKSTNSSPIKPKDETKSNPKKTMVFSPPNVTTRTAILKSQIERNTVPDFLDDNIWNDYKKSFPWVYSSKNVFHCSFCEEAYKAHTDTMTPSTWTCPDTVNYSAMPSLNPIKAKGMLVRHEKSKNHEFSVQFMSKPKEDPVKLEKEPISEISEPVSDFRIPTTVKASRKSAPVKLINLSFDENINSCDQSPKDVQKTFLQRQSSRKPSSRKTEPIAVEPSDENQPIPPFCTEAQFSSLKLRYPWMVCKDINSFGCSVCLEAVKIQPDALNKTRLTSGFEQFDPNLAYYTFRKKLYRHDESVTHKTAGNIVNNCDKYQVDNLNSSIDSSSSESRSTRLKTGSRTKIDYKRMSEGIMVNHEAGHSYKEIVTPVVAKKRKESSTTWMCPQCISHFSNTEDLIQHISLCDYQPSDSTKKLACPCNPSTYQFNAITKLDLHAAQEHDTQSYFHCYICSDRYNRLALLYHHMLIHHLITWDPFEAYLPVEPSEVFVCLFCSSHHYSNILLAKHYCHSDCNVHLQTRVILDDISRLHPVLNEPAQEEVTILDVEELPEDKEIIYSPVKKIKNQHNRISRNHPLRRFGPTRKESLKKPKESEKLLESKSSNSSIKESKKSDIDEIIESVAESNSMDELVKRESTNEIKPVKNDSFQNDSQTNEHDNGIKTIVDDPPINKSVDSSFEVQICQPINDPQTTLPIITSQITLPIVDSQINPPVIDSNINQTVNIDSLETVPVNDLSQNESIIDSQINETIIDSQLNESSIIDIKPNDSNINELATDPIQEVKNNEMEIVEPIAKVARKRRASKKFKIEETKIEEPIRKVRGRKSLKKLKTTPKSDFKSPVVVRKLIEIPQVVDLNDILKENETKDLLSEPKTTISVSSNQTTPEQVRHKKQPIKIQSQLSPCKKLKTIDRADDDIPTGLSFMDRMKKIRQLKKIRTEQQREQMMAVDRKIAEINEKTSLADKSDRIRKLITSEQYSMEDLKTIIQMESQHKSEKRKSITCDNQDNSKIEQSKPPAASPIKGELFSCDVCQLKFKSFRARDNHTTADHKGLKLFCCKACDMSFTTHILLRKHAQKYHIDNVSFAVFGKENSSDIDFSFQCSFCPLQFTSRSGLNHHITSGHKLESENGPIADEFLSKLIIADPRYSPQSCLICQEIMDNEFELDIHTIEHQKECQTTESEPTQFACPKCCRLFFGRDGKSYLKDHYNIVHLEKQLPVCEECDTRFVSTVCYSLHRKNIKNCSKKTVEQLKIEDPYEKLNDPMKLAFVCSRCQTLVAGESAQSRFEQHQIICKVPSSNDDLLVAADSQTECLDGQ